MDLHTGSRQVPWTLGDGVRSSGTVSTRPRLEPSGPRGGQSWRDGGVTSSLCTLGRAWLLRGADGGRLGSFLKEEPGGILGCGGLQGVPLTDRRGAAAGGQARPVGAAARPQPVLPRWAMS